MSKLHVLNTLNAFLTPCTEIQELKIFKLFWFTESILWVWAYFVCQVRPEPEIEIRGRRKVSLKHFIYIY